jgi:RimJ/RimL family protein N-acetyltransferase
VTVELTPGEVESTHGLIAIPYHPLEGNPIKNTIILDAAVAHPHWWSAPTTPEERRIAAAAMLTNPDHRTWEVWRGGDLVGILLLWRISLRVDALFHFVFFDRNLVGKRALLRNFLAYCFTDLGFVRLSMEVPEQVQTLISFARRKLGFKYEGEHRQEDHEAVKSLGVGTTGKLQEPARWVAQQGSRRERAHWHEGEWRDLVCLRLLRDEYFGTETTWPQHSPHSSPSPEA